ncbi:MAG: NADAR family protein [Firmicutes bacterium]|nr:NADAR family protein [Bacillota bacterium]
MKIDSFRGEYYFLSNFYEAPVQYGQWTYRNNEAAFQAQKCMTEGEKEQFTQLPSNKAKHLGRRVQLRPDWEEVKVGIMEEVVRAKFSQNPELKEQLLATGETELIEGNTWNDTFWGVSARSGRGQNHLGKILMKIRKEFKNI